MEPLLTAKRIKKVAIIGAGFMGSSIARFFALRQIQVVLKDKDSVSLQKGLAMAGHGGASAYTNALQVSDADKISPFIYAALDDAGLKDADLIIEAVPEDVEIKKKAFETINKACAKDAIIATNTSAIPIARLAPYVDNPQRFLGIHFFYPADTRPLVEIVQGQETDKDTVQTIDSFLKALGKNPTIVRDGPGFLVNRAIAFYISEITRLLLDGMAVDVIDRMMLDFGMPVGSLFYLDLVGIDTAYHIAKAMVEAMNSPRLRLPEVIASLYMAKQKGEDTIFTITAQLTKRYTQ